MPAGRSIRSAPREVLTPPLVSGRLRPASKSRWPQRPPAAPGMRLARGCHRLSAGGLGGLRRPPGAPDPAPDWPPRLISQDPRCRQLAGSAPKPPAGFAPVVRRRPAPMNFRGHILSCNASVDFSPPRLAPGARKGGFSFENAGPWRGRPLTRRRGVVFGLRRLRYTDVAL